MPITTVMSLDEMGTFCSSLEREEPAGLAEADGGRPKGGADTVGG
jgi:hypothetical protein